MRARRTPELTDSAAGQMAEIVIRDPKSRRMFRDGRRWTLRLKAARHFRNLFDAMTCCAQHDISHAEVVVHFHEPSAAAVVVPVSDTRAYTPWASDQCAEITDGPAAG